jgi:hypothetical protein
VRCREKAKAYCDSLNIEYRVEAVRESIINQKVPKRYEDNFRCAFRRVHARRRSREADFALGPKSCVARASASCPGARYEARIRTNRQQRREGEGAGMGSRCGITIGTFSWVTNLVFAESLVRACVCVCASACVCVRAGGRAMRRMGKQGMATGPKNGRGKCPHVVSPILPMRARSSTLLEGQALALSGPVSCASRPLFLFFFFLKRS